MTGRRRLGPGFLAAVAAVILLGGSPLAGQDTSEAEALDVSEGYRVRLATPLDTLQGIWLAPLDGRVRVGTADGVRSVPLSRVESLRVRTTRARTGALVGAVAGGVVTGLFVGLLAEGLCEVDCGGPDEFLYGLAAGGGVGAVGGGIAGAVVGSWVLTWRPVWP